MRKFITIPATVVVFGIISVAADCYSRDDIAPLERGMIPGNRDEVRSALTIAFAKFSEEKVSWMDNFTTTVRKTDDGWFVSFIAGRKRPGSEFHVSISEDFRTVSVLN